ncbi:MAG: cellobiose phosphorylase [Anaerolineae bacterium]|nr:cellobiose phosphorylase [Anaerolineae bacterium]
MSQDTSDVDLLQNLASQLAKNHTVSFKPSLKRAPCDRLRGHEATLQQAHEHFAQMSEAQQPLPYAGEWVLDNFYVIQQALRQVCEDMPESYYRQLPRLDSSPLEGNPRVYALAWEVLGCCDRHLNIDQVIRFVQAYQQVTPLTMGELWAIPTMLRFGALECLAYASALGAGLAVESIKDGVSPPLLKEGEQDKIVANCILSLRLLAAQDWKVFFETVSRVEEVLRLDPAGVYPCMDFDARDRYRKVVEKLALAVGQSEEQVARAVVELARENCAADSAGASLQSAHIGFYLLGMGRAELEKHLGYRPPQIERLGRWTTGHALPLYLGLITLFTLILVSALAGYALATGGTVLQFVGAILFSTLPATSIAVNWVNWLITHTVPPRTLPRMDFRDGIPAEHSTMVVVPCLLLDAAEVDTLLQRLELHFLGNTDPHLYFALLTDFTDAPQEHMPGDAALLDRVRAGIQGLNRKHGGKTGGPFYLFHRHRLWNPGENCWMGWERKRGKLIEFNRRLQGSQETSYSVQEGNMDVLSHIRYVITLDADTSLPPLEGARRLVATLAHPLNQAQFDPRDGTLVSGYTVLQPRVEIRPASANRTRFTKIFAGDTGLDLYTRAVSDVYQDLFGEGNYTGKGIYDVAAFERCLEGRAPENTLLSHDLFEGIHGRAGLVTDIFLFEDYPPNYLTYIRRLHRWVRGDWQLLPWLLPRVPTAGGNSIPNDLSPLDRWKIVDNLRRSLLAPALLALLIAGWLWLPGSAWVWTIAAAIIPATPLIINLGARLSQAMRRRPRGGSRRPLVMGWWHWLIALALIPCEAASMVDAIGCTLVRLAITRKRLLQWTTAAHTVRLFGRELGVGLLWRQFGFASIIAIILGLLIGWIDRTALPAAAPLLLVWLLSPQLIHWLGRSAKLDRETISDHQRQQLRHLARCTWLYFEQFVGPDDHWLPPDHFQENPRGLVAHRTSPTNIGLMLLSTMAAYDMGYIGPVNLMLRLRASFEGIGKLTRWRGHLLNWYDTRTLSPLPPPYISTVDSGNLAGCLLALGQGLLALPSDPILSWRRWEGLLDTLGVLIESVERPGGQQSGAAEAQLKDYLLHFQEQILAAGDKPEQWGALLKALGERMPELDQRMVALFENSPCPLDTATLQDLRLWLERLRQHLHSMQEEAEMLLPWLIPLSSPPAIFLETNPDPALPDAWQELCEVLPFNPSIEMLASHCKAGRTQLKRLQDLLADQKDPTEQVQAAQTWCTKLAEKLYATQMAAQTFLIGFRDLEQQIEADFQAMDFRFLFNSRRQVFYIGYNLEAGRPDANHYDLLASEARIASLVAIAKGEIPQRHWLYLGRPLVHVDGTRGLLSWNGSMFEYLMPSLLMRSYEGTLIDQTCQAVIDQQIAYGRQKKVPWGVSESGYHRFDANQNYQYRGFGVPGLGLKRGLGEDLVIAPYASLLALPFRPQAVLSNVQQLIDQGMLGHYGFYEAIDFTRSRLAVGQEHAVIHSYMVHHQSMTLLALVNYLQDEIMLRRFHGDPRMQSVELLLQEQVPRQVPIEQLPEEAAVGVRPARPRVDLGPWRVPIDAPTPQAHLLSNGRYSLLITASGGGYSSWQGIDLTRWRPDATLDNWGTWIYVQDRKSGALWSACYQPVGAAAEERAVLFSTHHAEFHRRDHDIVLRMEVTIPPGDDVEIRRIRLVNESDRPRLLRITSYGEVVLAPQHADRRHPAFNRLFIESEYMSDLNALLFRRRPRSADEKAVYALHMLIVGREERAPSIYEGDRARFLGRGRSPRSPLALVEAGRDFSGTTGATLDPIMSIGQDVMLQPHVEMQFAYLTLAAESRAEALALARRYRTRTAVERAFEQARMHSELELHQLGLAAADVERFQRLLSVLLYPHPALRASPKTLAANQKGQPGLWPYAISGDHPILVVRISEDKEMGLVRELLQAHAYWRSRQTKIDLVILNKRETAYDQELQGQLYRLIVRTGGDAWMNQRGGIFLLRADQLGDGERVLLETAARAVLDGGQGGLAEHLQRLDERPTYPPRFVATLPTFEDEQGTPPVPRPAGLLFDNGLGGFSPDGREYVIYLEPGQWTPAPWANVVANPEFGSLISEAGAGYTWAENSGENRLTPWRNDPVTDAPGEALYLRDEETGHVWSPTPLPAGAPVPYLVRHGAGYSIFEHNSHRIKQRLCLFIPPHAPVKIIRLELENIHQENRRITATFYAEWVLGTERDTHQAFVIPEFDAINNTLLARNPYNEEFGERVAFLAASKEPHSLTTDRTEFLGQRGSVGKPAALERVGLTGTVRAGLDPCAALQVQLWLAPGKTQTVFFLLGQGKDRQEALRMVGQYRDAATVQAAWDATTWFWDDILGAVTVQTPETALDLLLNRWLLYQALACRLWGRSALYQSSGAFGYRDQLQDVMALAHAAPELARAHILQAARRQFEAGDVLHWWHPPSGRGVRTRCSDDLLWLPFVTSHYVATTQDTSILTERVPFLRGAPLAAEEHERYGRYESTTEGATLYEHCCRALERGATAGEHGLPLIGSHDWNDGMNRVGIEGRGESVWLGWFLHATWTRFAALCEQMEDSNRLARCLEKAGELKHALEQNAWDGAWYLRAYYDDGTPLGSAESTECQIDSLAQSWAVLSRAADLGRAQQAMQAVVERLVREQDRLVLLFDPPFDKTARDPGYIRGYLPGIRENGGQYTHAALWVAWAFAELGDGDRAEGLLRLLNPIHHGDGPEKLLRYRVEPYVVAADVYSVPPHVGRGGWTWYTGSAAWMYRLALEAILGIQRAGETLRIDPCIPQAWPGFETSYRYGRSLYHIRVENPGGVNRGVAQLVLDGQPLAGQDIPLSKDGQRHQVHVRLG